jgi:hypothetical protein
MILWRSLIARASFVKDSRMRIFFFILREAETAKLQSDSGIKILFLTEKKQKISVFLRLKFSSLSDAT